MFAGIQAPAQRPSPNGVKLTGVSPLLSLATTAPLDPLEEFVIGTPQLSATKTSMENGCPTKATNPVAVCGWLPSPSCVTITFSGAQAAAVSNRFVELPLVLEAGGITASIPTA